MCRKTVVTRNNLVEVDLIEEDSEVVVVVVTGEVVENAEDLT